MRLLAAVRRTILPLLAIIAVGCSSAEESSLNEPSARNALVTFLDAWKAGSANDLLQDNVPITVTDADWSAGATLVSYQLAGDLINDGSKLETLVDLTLRRSGQEEVVRAMYTISTEQNITINRSDVPSESSN